MNYREDMEACIEYIEQHLKDEITIGQLAGYIHYSVFHFSRIFQACYDMAPMEYIRYRKLLLAMNDLSKGTKVTRASMDYGFDTPSGFAKAFRREFGITPKQVYGRQIVLPPRIVHKAAFDVIGFGMDTGYANPEYSNEIAAYWKEYELNGLEEILYKNVNPSKHGEYGICLSDYKTAGSKEDGITYLFGVLDEKMGATKPLLEKMLDSRRLKVVHVQIPEADYVVFTTPAIDTSDGEKDDLFAQSVKDTWKYIFEEWFPNSEYEYALDKQDFEFYDERCHYQVNSVMDIYIPVRKKE